MASACTLCSAGYGLGLRGHRTGNWCYQGCNPPITTCRRLSLHPKPIKGALHAWHRTPWWLTCTHCLQNTHTHTSCVLAMLLSAQGAGAKSTSPHTLPVSIRRWQAAVNANGRVVLHSNQQGQQTQRLLVRGMSKLHSAGFPNGPRVAAGAQLTPTRRLDGLVVSSTQAACSRPTGTCFSSAGANTSYPDIRPRASPHPQSHQ